MYRFKLLSVGLVVSFLLTAIALMAQAPGQPGTPVLIAKPATPTITNLSALSGVVGASVTITGSGFNSTRGSGIVTFNGTAVTSYTSWSAISITVLVPTGATTGSVFVLQNGIVSNGISFTVSSGSTGVVFSTTFPRSPGMTEADGIFRSCGERSQTADASGAVAPFWFDAVICSAGDGLLSHGSQGTTGHPRGDQITAAANFIGGAQSTGMGFRHWVCDGHDCNAGGLKVEWPSAPHNPVYLRYYIRFMAGFAWLTSSGGTSPGYTKDIYGLFNQSPMPNWTNGVAADNEKTWVWRGTNCSGAGGLQTICSAVGRGWQFLMGGTVGDGLFHCRQLEIDSRLGSGATIVRMWDNGTLLLERTNADWPTGGGSLGIVLGSNNDSAANGPGDGYVDFDEVELSTVAVPSCPYASGV